MHDSDHAGVTYIGPRAFALAFCALGAIFLAVFLGLNHVTDAVESAQPEALVPVAAAPAAANAALTAGLSVTNPMPPTTLTTPAPIALTTGAQSRAGSDTAVPVLMAHSEPAAEREKQRPAFSAVGIKPVIVPVVPVEPIVSVKPIVPVNRVASVKPIVPVKPVASVKPVVPVKPVASVKPIVPVKPLASVKPVVPVKSVASVKRLVPVKPVALVKPVVSVKPVAAVKPVIPVKPVVAVSRVSVKPVVSVKSDVPVKSTAARAPAVKPPVAPASRASAILVTALHAEPRSVVVPANRPRSAALLVPFKASAALPVGGQLAPLRAARGSLLVATPRSPSPQPTAAASPAP